MRKKSYFTLALFGAILGLGAFSSCKDNAEEIYHDLRVENEDQKQGLQGQIDQLASDILKLQQEKCNCTGCQCPDPVDPSTDCTCKNVLDEWKKWMTDHGFDCPAEPTYDDMFTYFMGCHDKDCENAIAIAKAAYEALMGDGAELTPEKIAEFKAKIKQAIDDLADIRAAYAELVTSVNINATENALVGYLNTPFGLSSKTLFAFYGVSKNTLNFPATSASSTGYIDAEEALTQSEIDMFKDKVSAVAIASDEIVVASEEGNAGTVYLTLNPNNVDFSKLQSKNVRLVNSQGVVSPVNLTPITKSDKILQFGYTRADEHYLYESKATITPEAINELKKDKVEWEMDELIQTAKDLVSAVRNRSISEIASFVYDKLNPDFDAYGVETPYRGLKFNDVVGTNTVVSNYEIAAAAIEAPNLNLVKTVQDKLSDRNLPGIGRVHNMIDRVAKQFHIDFPAIKINDLTIDKITLKELDIKAEKIAKFRVELSTYLKVDNDQYEIYYSDHGSWALRYIDTKEWINDIEITDADAALLGDADKSNDPEYVPAVVIIDLTGAIEDVIKDVYGQALAPINDVNKMIDDINNYLADVNDALAQLNDLEASVNGIADPIVKSLNRVLDRFNSLATRAMGHIDYLVKPALLCSDSEGSKMLSRSKYMPTKIAADANFLATSMSAEVLVPFAKKHVAVVNVFDAAGNVAADAQAKAAAVKGLNEVVDGGVNAIAASGFEAGYIYELAYSVVDYAGYVSTRRFFVTVK